MHVAKIVTTRFSFIIHTNVRVPLKWGTQSHAHRSWKHDLMHDKRNHMMESRNCHWRFTNNFQTFQQFGEATGFVSQQFLWRSEFGNRPIIHHQNKIRVQDCVETVGNRDHSALLKLLPHHFLSILVKVKYWWETRVQSAVDCLSRTC